jgi:voltage-gated potassium channel
VALSQLIEPPTAKTSIEHLRAEGASVRPWTQGRVTAFVARHRLAWELFTAGLTVIYVVLAFLHDQGSAGLITVGVWILAITFVIEFIVRFYDSHSRRIYLRNHWLDIVTCIPVVGPFRALRLIRLIGFIRLGAAARSYGVGAASSGHLPGGVGVWVLAPILITVWLGASYSYYELEGGVNPNVNNFGDALFYSFITASTVGYGTITPVTPEGKVLTGVLIFLSIGLLGFASAQLTAKLLPQRSEAAELKATIDRQCQLLDELHSQLDVVTRMLETRSSTASLQGVREEVPQVA